jgi:hypothetical protein
MRFRCNSVELSASTYKFKIRFPLQLRGAGFEQRRERGPDVKLKDADAYWYTNFKLHPLSFIMWSKMCERDHRGAGSPHWSPRL